MSDTITTATATAALATFGADNFRVITTPRGNRFVHFEINEAGLFELMEKRASLGFPLRFSQADFPRYVIALDN
jgi:hypothetical protein